MIRIGIAGIGFMGRIHFLAAQRLQDAKVVAIASRDPKKRAGDWSQTRGNFGPEPGMVDLAGITAHETLEQMLADPTIDLIDICNPTQQHPETAIAALEAGKHVLVEKAIALTPGDADRMLAAAKKAGKLLMVAHVLPFFPEFRYVADLVRSGSHGRLLGAHFTRVIAKPDWSADIADASKTGGPAVDLHIHDTHYIGLLAGIPQAVYATGQEAADGSVEYLTTQYLYGKGGPTVTCSSGAIAMPGRPFIHGFEVYLEKATLSHDSRATPLTLYTSDGKVEQPQFPGAGDPIASFAEELQMAVQGVRTGKEPDLLSGQLARDALVMCLKECESVRQGQPVAMQ